MATYAPLIKLLIFIVIAFLLLQTPALGKYVSLLNTLIHEAGHAIMALLTGGRVSKIELFANTEGTAWSSNRYWFGRVLTSFAGYPAASLTAFFFLYFTRTGNYPVILGILLGVLLITAVFWIRNLYGIFWVLTFGAAFIGMLWLDNPMLSENVSLFLTAVLSVASITTAFEILILSFKRPMDAGDATNLWRSIVFIPPQIWGLFFFLQALALVGLGIWQYLQALSV